MAAALGTASGFALTLVLLGWVFAGMDYTIYSYALPLILSDLNISIPTAGLIFFLSLQGTFVGSLLAGALADSWGRRRVMMGNILLYALSTGTVALAQSAGFLTGVRFLINFGVGAEQPVGGRPSSRRRRATRRSRRRPRPSSCGKQLDGRNQPSCPSARRRSCSDWHTGLPI